MRAVIWLVLLFAAAVATATLLGRNDALVSIYYGGWRLDVSLNLFLLGLAVSVFGAYRLMRTADSLWNLPTRAREWRALKRERAAEAALREALAELFAARFARAQRASQHALELQADVPALKDDAQFGILARTIAASAMHQLQNREGRNQRVEEALALGTPRASSAHEGVMLLNAEWAVDDRQAERGLALLGELPPGVGRRTQALRLKLRAAQLLRQPLEGLQTARLLAKHQGSKEAAQSLLRSLAMEALEQTYDLEQLGRVWQALDRTDRADAWVVAKAARQACALGDAALGRHWLQTLWPDLGKYPVEARAQLALALVECAPGLGSDWLPRVESALAMHGHEPALVAAAAMAFADRQLWGKARRLLEQTATADTLPAPVRRQALRCLAALAREESQDEAAAAFDQRAAAID
ncbi:heme biosynthesis HemY N-terminal domain-containing protein [Vitreoscilla filiformis]|uniref:heme biosynthesis HemY N-terminal domain-containing protein n=1 Tax=Vitreoscilla filiformis TaxID=63 RepID=UPI000B79FC14|nr:heme biosynthesis HemY N-terminal domain-containing protein [Vitreoscilla filiformis]